MRVENFTFDNRYGLKIHGEVWIPDNPIGLAFIQRGFTGSYDRPSPQIQARTFYQNGYSAVLFDSTNGWNQSGGKIEDALPTRHIQDLEDVISWGATQPFYHEPFILVGDSLGGLSALHFTLLNRNRVKALVLISSIISGKLRQEAYERFAPDELKQWQETGFKTKHHPTDPNMTAQLPYAYMEDALRYDMLAEAHHIHCPILMIAGENDNQIPPDHQHMLRDKLSGPKELVIVPNGGHVFRAPEEFQMLEQALDRWLKSLP